jgi:hypothetical protein
VEVPVDQDILEKRIRLGYRFAQSMITIFDKQGNILDQVIEWSEESI